MYADGTSIDSIIEDSKYVSLVVDKTLRIFSWQLGDLDTDEKYLAAGMYLSNCIGYKNTTKNPDLDCFQGVARFSQLKLMVDLIILSMTELRLAPLEGNHRLGAFSFRMINTEPTLPNTTPEKTKTLYDSHKTPEQMNFFTNMNATLVALRGRYSFVDQSKIAGACRAYSNSIQKNLQQAKGMTLGQEIQDFFNTWAFRNILINPAYVVPIDDCDLLIQSLKEHFKEEQIHKCSEALKDTNHVNHKDPFNSTTSVIDLPVWWKLKTLALLTALDDSSLDKLKMSFLNHFRNSGDPNTLKEYIAQKHIEQPYNKIENNRSWKPKNELMNLCALTTIILNLCQTEQYLAMFINTVGTIHMPSDNKIRLNYKTKLDSDTTVWKIDPNKFKVNVSLRGEQFVYQHFVPRKQI